MPVVGKMTDRASAERLSIKINEFVNKYKSKGISFPDCTVHQILYYLEFIGKTHLVLDMKGMLSRCTCKSSKMYKGPWAFTLTLSPSDKLGKEDLIKAVGKLMTQRSIPISKYIWYYEDKGIDSDGKPLHPHIHGMYETPTGGSIHTKYWRRYWPIWDPSIKLGAGFRGGYHRPVRDGEGYGDYIAKDGKESGRFGLEE